MSIARAGLLVGLLSLGVAGTAHAQIVVIRSAGETIESVGLVPVANRDAVRTLTSMGAIEVGYVYQYTSLYTLKVWASDGRFCLYMDRQYWVITPEQAAAILGVSTVEPPFAYRFPTGLMALVVGGLVVLGFTLWGKRLADWLERKFPPERA